MVVERAMVIHDESLGRPGGSSKAGPATCRLDDGQDYKTRLSLAASQLGTDRLLLLTSQFRVAFDSGNPDPIGEIAISASKRVNGVQEARINLDGQTYLVAAMAIAPARDPLAAAYIVLAAPQGAFAAAAANELVPRLLLTGGAALVLAMLLVLLASRSLTRPPGKLAT